MNILLISTVINKSLRRAVEAVRDHCNVNLIYANELNKYSIDDLQKFVDESDIILIDVRGDPGVLKNIDFRDKDVVVLVGGSSIMSRTKLGSFRMPARTISEISNPDSIKKRIDRIQKSVEALGKILPFGVLKDARNYVRIMKYWANAGFENYKNMFLYICKIYGKKVEYENPREFPEYGFYHLTEGFEYLPRPNSQKPTIGIVFYGGMHFESCLGVLELLSKKLEGFNVIPVFSEGILNLKALELLYEVGDVDAIVSLLWFRLDGGPLGGHSTRAVEMLKKTGAKLFTPAMMFMQSIDSWKNSPRGIDPLNMITSVTLPEMDGGVEPIPLCGISDQEVVPIEDRVDKFAQRVKKWMELRRKDNSDKRIAIVIYNYPPGEENLGRAAYLDTFKSLEVILNEMRRRGYRVDEFDVNSIIDKRLFNPSEMPISTIASHKMKLEDYLKFFQELPIEIRDEVVKWFGPPPGTIMTENNDIVIPAVVLGNVAIVVQPARKKLTTIEDLFSEIHDNTKPPHHQYLATYFWIERVFKADAVIHLGTHGTAEFTKGKEVGLSSKCYPDILIGSMPSIYVYHAVNTSEGAIAKRRLYATLISYNSPPYTFAGLYEDYLKLEDLIEEYREYLGKDPAKCEIAKRKALELAKKLNLGEDLYKIELKLYELKRSIIPKGLHILGERYSDADLRNFLLATSMVKIGKKIAELRGEKFEELDIRKKKDIEKEVERIVDSFLAGEKIDKEIESILHANLESARKFVDNSLELQNLIEALEGKYVEPSIGGDVIRNPDALPTGRNIYPFDPTRIPTMSASERGVAIANNTLRRYKEKMGRYPETVGVVLWGFECAKTHGETVSQIFEYLGVELIHKTPWEKEIRVKPLQELKRPRIDVAITICGFFREMFPNLIELIDKAIRMMSELDEPEELNYVKKHRDVKHRIFGPRNSEYGTRMLSLVEDGAWNEPKDLVEAYVSSMCFAYGKDCYGVEAREDFEKILRTVELTSQIRSSTDYEITDLDHYYEFFGGLVKSVELIRGKKPEMVFVDSTMETPKIESLEEAIERGSITRTLNPLWIEENLKHGFLGVQKILDRIENLLGLSATTNAVHNSIWNKVFERYVLDENMYKRLRELNKFATKKIIERLMEAERRGLWKANQAQRKVLEDRFYELEGILEEVIW